MSQFYHYLWVEKQPPLDALRHAQRALLWHPGEVPDLAKRSRGEFLKTVKRVSQLVPPEKRTGPTPVKHWAAFVLSGAER